MAATEVRDRTGEMVPDPTVPTHHWRCDGETGRTPSVNPLERLPVACGVCRPHLSVRPQRDGRRPMVTLA
jgi:hypothetical protein